MSWLSLQKPLGGPEHLLVASPGRDIAVTAVTLALTTVVFAAA